MMSTNQQSTIIAVFVNRDQANQAIDTLRHAGFSYDQMRLVQNGTNSFVEDLKSLFTGQTTTSTNSADDWMRIGVPEQDAHHYQSELDAGRSIILLKAVSSPDQSLSMLHQSGAYDISFRFRTAPPTMPSGMNTSNAQPGTYNPNAQPGAYDPNAQQGTYNPNTQPGAYDPTNTQQGTYNATQPQPRQPVTRDEQNATR
jgi:hypothetical protein